MSRDFATTMAAFTTLGLGVGLSALAGTALVLPAMRAWEEAGADRTGLVLFGIVLLAVLSATFPCVVASAVGRRVAASLGAPPLPAHRHAGFLRGTIAYFAGVGAGFVATAAGGALRHIEAMMIAALAAPMIGLLVSRAVLRAPEAARPALTEAPSTAVH